MILEDQAQFGSDNNNVNIRESRSKRNLYLSVERA